MGSGGGWRAVGAEIGVFVTDIYTILHTRTDGQASPLDAVVNEVRVDSAPYLREMEMTIGGHE